MRTGWLCIAGVVLLGAASPLWAGPFSEVPSDHWAYRACARLTTGGILAKERQADFTGNPRITRFEFGIALLGPLTEVDKALASLGGKTDSAAQVRAVLRALAVSPRQSESEIAGSLRDLRRLTVEFKDVLESLGLEPERALRGLAPATGEEGIRVWRLSMLHPMGSQASLPRTDAVGTATTVDAVRVPIAKGLVGLSLTNLQGAPELLDYMAKSASAAHPLSLTGTGTAEAAIADPRVSRLRTTYEYGVGSALTLSLAYEEIARRGQGLAELDAASLTSLGIGYQLTPSTTVKLSYSLLDYANYALDAYTQRDRMAETAVSIEF